HRLSASAQRLIMRRAHPESRGARRTRRFEKPVAAPEAPVAAAGPKNVRVNSPSEDKGKSDNTTQSEPSLAVLGNQIVVGFNDSTPVSSFSGYATSSDGGKTFVDRGGIDGQQSGDAVIAAHRSGVFYYAMLSTDAHGHSCIGVAKSADHGATFSAPVDASTTANGAGPLFQDKE